MFERIFDRKNSASVQSGAVQNNNVQSDSVVKNEETDNYFRLHALCEELLGMDPSHDLLGYVLHLQNFAKDDLFHQVFMEWVKEAHWYEIDNTECWVFANGTEQEKHALAIRAMEEFESTEKMKNFSQSVLAWLSFAEIWENRQKVDPRDLQWLLVSEKLLDEEFGMMLDYFYQSRPQELVRSLQYGYSKLAEERQQIFTAFVISTGNVELVFAAFKRFEGQRQNLANALVSLEVTAEMAAFIAAKLCKSNTEMAELFWSRSNDAGIAGELKEFDKTLWWNRAWERAKESLDHKALANQLHCVSNQAKFQLLEEARQRPSFDEYWTVGHLIEEGDENLVAAAWETLKTMDTAGSWRYSVYCALKRPELADEAALSLIAAQTCIGYDLEQVMESEIVQDEIKETARQRWLLTPDYIYSQMKALVKEEEN